AQARIVAMAPTPSGARRTGALDVEQRFRLSVTSPDGSSFEAEHVCKVPHAKSPLLGDVVPVDVDPDERSIVRIVFGEMPSLADRAQASAAAAQAGDSAAAAAALGFKLSADKS